VTLSADRPVVTLLDGRSVSSWGPEWQAECLARHHQVVRIMRLDDREARRDFIARYERTAADTAPPGTPDRAAYAAEARRRLEAAVLDHWQRARAAQAA
jgi:hypothetical protein